MPLMADSIVKASGLAKDYGSGKAVKGVTLEASKGEVLVLLGPPDAGKTVTLMMLQGLARPDSGEARVLGFNPADQDESARLRLRTGMMAGSAAGFERLTARENLEFFKGAYGSKVSTMELFAKFGLSQRSRDAFSRLKARDRQLLGLATAICNDPEVVFLDEPTKGLDSDSKFPIWDAIKKMAGEGRTIILATCSTEEAERVADRIAVMVRGEVVAQGAPRQLLASYSGGKSVVFKSGGDAAFGTLRRFFDSVSMEGSDVLLPFENIRDLEVALRELVGRGISPDIEVRTPNLGDVLRKLMGAAPTPGGSD